MATSLFLPSTRCRLFFLLLVAIAATPTRAQFWDNEQRMVPVGDADHFFGVSIAMGANTLAVGAPKQDLNATEGAVHLYTRSDAASAWMYSTTLEAPANLRGFGMAVAVSPTGRACLVGAPGSATAVWYTQTAGTWSSPQILVPTNTALYTGYQFGWSVALSDTKVAIGAPHARVSHRDLRGAVHLYSYTDGAAGTPQSLQIVDAIGTLEPGERFGQTLALTDTKLVVGTPFSHGTRGKALVYVPNAATGDWILSGSPLTVPTLRPRDGLGQAVAQTESVIAVSAVGTQDERGSVFLYEATTPFRLITTLQGSLPGDRFGISLEMTTDSDTGVQRLAVGSEASGTGMGKVSTFGSTDGGLTWTPETVVVANAPEQFGEYAYSMALSTETLVVAAPWTMAEGAVYSYQTSDESPPTASPVAMPTPVPTQMTTAPPTSTPLVPLYLNCGSSRVVYTGVDGTQWLPDQDYSVGTSELYDYGRDVAGTEDDELFATDRNSNDLQYSIPVAPGTYKVTLWMAEMTFLVTNRPMQISINGAVLVNNYDLWVEAGGRWKAVSLVFAGIVVDGNALDIRMTSVGAQVAKLNALVVQADRATGPAGPTPAPATRFPTYTPTAPPTLSPSTSRPTLSAAPTQEPGGGFLWPWQRECKAIWRTCETDDDCCSLNCGAGSRCRLAMTAGRSDEEAALASYSPAMAP